MNLLKSLKKLVNDLYNISLICFTGHYFNYRLFSEIIQLEKDFIESLKPEMKQIGTSMYDLPIITIESINDDNIKYGSDGDQNYWINYNYDTLIPKMKDVDDESCSSDRSDELGYNALGKKNSLAHEFFSDDEKIPNVIRRWSVAIDTSLLKMNKKRRRADKKSKRKRNRILSQLQGLEEKFKSEEYKNIENFLKSLCPKNEEPKAELADSDFKELVLSKNLSIARLETVVGNLYRAIKIRREIIGSELGEAVSKIPFQNYDYSKVHNCCIENCVGYVQVPVGIAGPNVINGKPYRVPMATTEGCLVASTNRGSLALKLSGGSNAFIANDGMTRGPFIEFLVTQRAVDAREWLKDRKNYEIIKKEFDSTSRFAKLRSIKTLVVGRFLYIRFVATTGNAMGMNMVSKGTEKVFKMLYQFFPDIKMTCLSGNMCTDKKSSLLNWTEGRGKSVVCEAQIPKHIVETVLRTSVKSLVKINTMKNLVGSSIAGTIGGYSAQAANVVAAIFIATGQDAAQVIGSSNCITYMELCGPDKQDLYISCSMPSIELGTIGGGTHLTAQRGCLDLLNLKEDSAKELAKVICGTVMAAELSLMASLSEGSLVSSHLRLNRSPRDSPPKI